MFFEGTGDLDASEPFDLSGGPYRVTTTFDERGVFEAKFIDETGRPRRAGGGVGPATVERYWGEQGRYTLAFEGDGGWTVTIAPLEDAPQAAQGLSGEGSAVSGLLTLPGGESAFAVVHDGQSNFVVDLQCGNSLPLLVNETGPVNGVYTVENEGDPLSCAWSVLADGSWEIAAR